MALPPFPPVAIFELNSPGTGARSSRPTTRRRRASAPTTSATLSPARTSSSRAPLARPCCCPRRTSALGTGTSPNQGSRVLFFSARPGKILNSFFSGLNKIIELHRLSGTSGISTKSVEIAVKNNRFAEKSANSGKHPENSQTSCARV